ncbi:hypothetical protein RND81_08G149900 [Saponaria officinalis]|uniref:Alkyl transferase n=1 Tax=Saponaria officinalis TaxID=3572 RepID=A0AAW1J7F3_SAPOF
MATISLFRRQLVFSSNNLLTCPKNLSLTKQRWTTIRNVCSKSEKFTKVEMEAMPKHVAICLDGNRRWCEARGHGIDYKPFFHKNVVFTQLCLKWGIPHATSLMWGLSNFTKRTPEASNFFLGQFQEFIEDNLEFFKREGIKVRIIGETTLLSKSIQETIKQVEEETKKKKRLELALTVCYTGQRDITNATRKLCEKVKEGVIEPYDITEDMIQNELSIPSSPIPDLFIRTGGEFRVGGLLSWQVSHIELFFTDVMAPDFGEHLFIDALRSYLLRSRKFGK